MVVSDGRGFAAVKNSKDNKALSAYFRRRMIREGCVWLSVNPSGEEG
jgi:hypothetical protein